MTKKSVLLSSTHRDLKERRERLIHAVLAAHLDPIGMEHDRRSDPKVETAEFCETLARKADLYVGILAWSYGSIAEGRDKSFTEIEFDAAGAAGKDRFVFIVEGNPDDAPRKAFDSGPDAYALGKKLEAFKERAKKTPRVVWIPFKDDADLFGLVVQTLNDWRGGKAIESTPQRVAPSRLTHAPDRLFGRENELEQLDAAWGNSKIRVVTLVAWGGVGKTSLVATWAAGLAARDYDGADYFDWSFYSQGASNSVQASGDAFVDAALRFFGDEAMADSPRSPWDKGARLAQLVAERRTLLVLDGLEPLQHPPGPLDGQLKDPAITALLKRLAQKNAGLCIITTRESVADLAAFHSTTAPERTLEHLSTEAGVALLESIGVHGTKADFERLVDDVRGHALTIDLLGRFLVRAHRGDVRRRDRVHLGVADASVRGGHAFKTIAAYESWLQSSGARGERQLAILRILGLFDRPADRGCIEALRRAPAIPGLTVSLVAIPEDDWNSALSDLRDARLLRIEGDSLDAHPLVRERFANDLHTNRLDAWRAAHSRLFDYLSESAASRPDSLAGLMPLYQALPHGCHAGRLEEAFHIYYLRIGRGSDFYSTDKLGAMGADLAGIACFFDVPWRRVSTAISEAERWLVNAAAFRLRALGRLIEAVEPMRAVYDKSVEDEEWEGASRAGGSWSELALTLGDIAASVHHARNAVEHSDKTGIAFLRVQARVNLGDALHHMGLTHDALATFHEAETIQAADDPLHPQLYSVANSRYCDLLLSTAERSAAAHRPEPTRAVECLDIEQRALRSRQTSLKNQWLLDIALDSVTISLARFYRALHTNESIKEALSRVDEAVDALRRSGQMDDMPRGLLARAWIYSANGDAERARADLDEAQEIAERGPMPLFLADVALYRARLFKDRAALAEARRLVDKHGYGRRLGELEDAEAAATSWPA